MSESEGVQEKAPEGEHPKSTTVKHWAIGIAVTIFFGCVAAGIGLFNHDWSDSKSSTDKADPPATAAPAAAPSSSFTPTATIEAKMQVANVTKGDSSFHDSVKAQVGDKLKFQIWFYNREEVLSGKYVSRATVKVFPSQTRSQTQTIQGVVYADNTHAAGVKASVNLDRRGPIVVPTAGDIIYRHNESGNDLNIDYVNLRLGQELFNAGATVGDLAPCNACEATVTFFGTVTDA